MKAITHLSFALFTSIGLGTVYAQPPGRPGDRDRPGLPVDRLMRLDQNEDGKLSADEVEETRVRAMIERADQDNDALVTREELEAFVPDRSAEGRSGDREARPREDRPREDRPREARPHDDRPEARGDRPEHRKSRRDAPRAERRSGEDRDFGKGPRGRRGPQHQRPDDRGFGRPDHGSHRPHGKMDPGRREGDRNHSHGPQSHGPQSHGPQDRGPQNRGPIHREPRAAGGPPAAGQVLPEFVQDRMDLNEEQRDALRKLQATVDSELKEILTEDQLQSMKQDPRNRPQPPEGAERGPRRGPPREFDRDDSRRENRRERPESVDA